MSSKFWGLLCWILAFPHPFSVLVFQPMSGQGLSNGGGGGVNNNDEKDSPKKQPKESVLEHKRVLLVSGIG